MPQDGQPDDSPGVFAVPPWNPAAESWEDFLRAVERTYATYVARRQQRSAAMPPGQLPPSADEVLLLTPLATHGATDD